MLDVCVEQGGPKAAMNMAEFWLKQSWDDITEDWEGDIRETPRDEESELDFHFNVVTPGFNVSPFPMMSWLLH